MSASNRRRRSIFDLIDEYLENLEAWAEGVRETLMERPSWNCRTCSMEPLRDIMVTGDEVIVTVDLPYAEQNTIQVKPVGKDAIEISAKMRRKISFDDFGITHYRGEFQRFHCQTRIPVPVYMDRMEIRFKRGILEIRLPRKHEYEIPVE
ncbi:MAG: Hsp20/alpha crystallin family protein [Candidatus Bathyarchaeota archaeon]|jgi:HSP20 family molecular chaperone IbpA|nr:Hsp20/alpha crystallin family protein [Candidatus Bathyarchaeota archaeon A05DMB-3]MDH7606312.1 Hsp20/alpha crystallin family protein [Candidatus Bathyarchaeota archaeon]